MPLIGQEIVPNAGDGSDPSRADFAALQPRSANYVPLSPLGFIRKAAAVAPDRPAVVYGDLVRSWRQTYERCVRLASALGARGIGRGDVVAVMAPNIPAMYEAHFGVPMAGAVLNTLNTRLDASAIAFQLRHGGAKVVLVDREFSGSIAAAVAQLESAPLLIDIDDALHRPTHGPLGDCDYEAFLLEGRPDAAWSPPTDEWQAIALNYTSGTTGDPKGVVTHHRGAYLNSLGQAVSWPLPQYPVYLWTLPLFHCNGWCLPWAVAAQAGINVCLRRVEPPLVLDLIARHAVTHMCGAPVVYSMLIDEADARGSSLEHTVAGMVAGAAPPSTMMERAERVGFDLTHVYGLTEVYGPSAICFKRPEWDALRPDDRAGMKARQGVAMLSQEDMAVLDSTTLEPVPADGLTVGEIMFRGNTTMSGYLGNPGATDAAFAGGWFRTGDLAVLEPDGYARITDRSKDVIISGGENISSLEVEEVLHRHASVALAAVVAMPDERWGEAPCAFVELREGSATDLDALRLHCRRSLAAFKIPKRFVLGSIARTATGKIQKFHLREIARRLASEQSPTGETVSATAAPN